MNCSVKVSPGICGLKPATPIGEMQQQADLMLVKE
jgi:hypothetical protein